MVFLDTNGLLCSISRSPDEAGKHARAIALLDRDDCGLPVQVLQAFYVQATRAIRRDALPHDIATGPIRRWLRFPVQEITVGPLHDALRIRAAHHFAHWDISIVAAVSALRCDRLCTENLSDGRTVDELTILNPFP